MIRSVRGPKGPLSPIVDIAEEVNRDTQTIRSLAERLKFPMAQIKLRSRHGNHRRMPMFCVEPKHVATLLQEASKLRRYRPGVRHSGGIVGSPANGQTKMNFDQPADAPVPEPTQIPIEISGVTREALAAALKPFVQNGLAKLSFDAATGDVNYAVQQVASFKI